jgi:hypothetical protein
MIKKYYKKAVPFLAIVCLLLLFLCITRAVSIARNAGSDGIQISGGTFLQYLWLELKTIFKPSHY